MKSITENTKNYMFKVALLCAVWILLPATDISYTAMGARSSAPVEMVLRNTPLKAALQAIARNHGYKLESDLPLSEAVNIDVSGTDLQETLDRLMSGKPYAWTTDNDVLRVTAAPASVAAESPVAKPKVQEPVRQAPVVVPDKKFILILENRRPSEVVSLLSPIASNISMVADPRTNAILMRGNKSEVEAITRMARDLDSIKTIEGMEEQREFSSEVFSLDYVSDFDDLEQNLNFILYGSSRVQDMSQQTRTGDGAGQIMEQAIVPVRKEYYLLDKVRRLLMITASTDKMEIIREYFEKVNTPLPQVLIEAHIVALDEGFERSAGINWNFSGTYQGPVRPTHNPLGIPESTGGGTQTDPASGFQFGQWNLSNLLATLQMAQDKNMGKILSQPKLMTLSGNEARIHIGTRYPYRASTTLNQTGGTAENIEYVDVGILLNVTPQVNQKSGTIVMRLSPEVSDVAGFRNDAPVITSRQTETVVEVTDGETVVIGGLLRDEEIDGRSGVPILREIPLVGEFFRFSRRSTSKTNLVIMITPRVVDVRGRTVKEVEQEKLEAARESQTTEYHKMVDKLRQRVQSREK